MTSSRPTTRPTSPPRWSSSLTQHRTYSNCSLRVNEHRGTFPDLVEGLALDMNVDVLLMYDPSERRAAAAHRDVRLRAPSGPAAAPSLRRWVPQPPPRETRATPGALRRYDAERVVHRRALCMRRPFAQSNSSAEVRVRPHFYSTFQAAKITFQPECPE